MALTPNMTSGYLGSPSLTADLLDNRGFAHMGDLGSYDTQGKLYYKERIKEQLKVNGRESVCSYYFRIRRTNAYYTGK